MNTIGRKAVAKDEWKFSSAHIMRRFAVLCVLVVILIAVGSVVVSINKMQDRAILLNQRLDGKIEYRINESINLLESLAAQDRYVDPSVPVEQKIDELERVSEQFGYLMIRYVDADINVWSSNGATSLASRDYMQRLFSTGLVQVTDSFPAGADGVTLNYTVAVPLKSDGDIVGCLFCAIYFDEIVEMLDQDSSQVGAKASIVGSENQIMSSTTGYEYGDPFIEALGGYTLFGTTAADIETGLLNKQNGSFWSMGNGCVYYTIYAPIENTNWKLVSTVELGASFSTLLPVTLCLMAAAVVLFALVMISTHRFVSSQLKVVSMLVESVKELEWKIY